MEVGIKVGFQDGIEILTKTKAKYCEVWFRLDWQEKYTPLFKYLNKNKIAFGLHFWAMIDKKYFPNLLYLKNNIASKTFKIIKETIDLASRWQATYVNFHPESYRLTLLDLDKSKMKTLNPNEPINRKKSFAQLLFYLKKIKKYSQKKKIIPFIETVPKFSPADFKGMKAGRLNPQKSEGLETEKFFQLTKLGYPICFDIGHTLAQYLTNNRDKLFNYLFKAAKKMLPNIGLIHVTTNAPPFNGTDSHNGVLEEDFKQKVLPNKIQLIKLLSLFKDKNVWLIPEPEKGKMIENYFALKKIVKEIKRNPC